VSGPLFHEGWIEYNRLKWKLEPFYIQPTQAGAGVNAVFYTDKTGKIRTPKLNAYSAIEIQYTPTTDYSKIYRQTIDFLNELIERIKDRKIQNHIYLPTSILDIRPFQWNGFMAQTAYTFVIEFPYSLSIANSSVKKNINKASKNGFIIKRVTSNFKSIIDCVKDTENRQKFSYGLTEKDLELLNSLMGEENFRCYAAYDQSGNVKATRIVLHSKNHRAIDLVAATDKNVLDTGITQLLINHILEDLQLAGASSFDFAGAGIPSVAQAKANWGATLTPYYLITDFNLRWLSLQIYQKFLKR